MPRPTSITVSSQTSSAAIPINYRGGQGTFAIGIGCVVSAGGSLTYKVQHTFDDVFDSSVTPTWFDHASITGKTANADGNYAYPIRAVRLTVTTYSSGNVTMTLVEAY